MTIPVIVGFTSSNRVPGFYGETVHGAGAISAGSIPLTLFLFGNKGSVGAAAPNADIVDILSEDDADAAFEPGFELTRMCYAALRVPGVKIKAGATAEAGGAVSATQVITISGSWTNAGTLAYRVNGETFRLTAGQTDSIADVCTNLAALFNEDAQRPFTSTATATQVILTIKSKGERGNSYITFQDMSKAPAGLVSRITGPVWLATTAYTSTAPISYAVPTTANGFFYRATTAGTTGGAEPTWPTTIGATVVDGTVTWTCWGKILTGGATTFGGGAGVESIATLLGLVFPQSFDRVVPAANDDVNLGLLRTQLNLQAGPTNGILQHATVGVNGSLSDATTLATTLNSQRMQVMWQLNGETAPHEIAAYFGALRCSTEQADPCAAYDDAPIVGAAPHSQPGDRPSNAVLQAAINNGLTPLYTDANGSTLLVCRSVTTRTLNGAMPDYRTLDTSDAYVPDFVRRDIGLYWSTVFRPSNPRNADDPPGDAKEALAGIATPKLWNSAVEAKLRNYEKGILASGPTPMKATVAPIIIDVDFNLPVSGYDPIAKRIMSIVPVVPAPNNHQIGVSVRQVSSA